MTNFSWAASKVHKNGYTQTVSFKLLLVYKDNYFGILYYTYFDVVYLNHTRKQDEKHLEKKKKKMTNPKLTMKWTNTRILTMQNKEKKISLTAFDYSLLKDNFLIFEILKMIILIFVFKLKTNIV